jgi:hypothetical protein
MSQNAWATIMQFGPVTNFLSAQKKFGPHLRHWYYYYYIIIIIVLNAQNTK